MLRRGVWTILTAGALFLVAAVQVSADTAPQPALTGGVKPVSASVGSSAQPNSSASVSSGRASTTADGNRADGTSCGAQAVAAGNGYGAQPTRVGTAGTSKPTGCASGGSATGSTANSREAANAASAKSGQTPQGAMSAVGLDGVANGAAAARSGPWFWLLLAALIGVLLFLLGVAVAPRRRRAASTA